MNVPNKVQPNMNRKKKPDAVQLKTPFSVLGVPNNMGRLELTILALGDDNGVYQWLGKEEAWYLFNT